MLCIRPKCEHEAKPGRKRCDYHLWLGNRKNQRLRSERRKAGVCVVCGGESSGKMYCAEHLREAVDRRTSKRTKNRTNGLCFDCTTSALPGKTRCEQHLAARKASREKYNAKYPEAAKAARAKYQAKKKEQKAA